MNTTERHDDIFSVEELESRFEMEVVPVGDPALLNPDWRIVCAIES